MTSLLQRDAGRLLAIMRLAASDIEKMTNEKQEEQTWKMTS